MRVMLGDDASAPLARPRGKGLRVRAGVALPRITNLLQLRVLRRRMNNQRRQHLFQHVAIFLEQQAKELLGVVRHQVDFDPVMNARPGRSSGSTHTGAAVEPRRPAIRTSSPTTTP